MDTTTIDPTILAALQTPGGLVGAPARHLANVAHERILQADADGNPTAHRYVRHIDDARAAGESAAHHLHAMLAAIQHGNPVDTSYEAAEAARMIAQAVAAASQARGFLEGVQAVITAEHRRHLEAGS